MDTYHQRRLDYGDHQDFQKDQSLYKILPPPNAEEISILVSTLSKIPQVEENTEVFANAIDYTTLQMKLLTNYTVPWSEPSIISMIDTLDTLKDTWLHTSEHNLIKEITKISCKIRTTTKHSELALTTEEVGTLVKRLSRIP